MDAGGSQRMFISKPSFGPRCLIFMPLVVCLITAACCGAAAQDTGDSKLPQAARLALRAKAGDVVKMEGDEKVATHFHLDALSIELSGDVGVKSQRSYQYRGRGPNGT